MRRLIGHRRRSAPEQMEGLAPLCQDHLRPYNDCFQPVMNLTGKKSVGNQSRKLHHRPTNPPRRVLAGGRAEPLTIRPRVAHGTTTRQSGLKRQPTASWRTCPPPWATSRVPEQPRTAAPAPPEPPAGDQDEHPCRHRLAQGPRRPRPMTTWTHRDGRTSPPSPPLPLGRPIPTPTTVSFHPDGTIAGKCDSLLIDNEPAWGAWWNPPWPGTACPGEKSPSQHRGVG